MNPRALPFAATLVLASLVSLTGCAVINSHSETKTFGTLVSDESLSRIEPGHTTVEWLMATLGAPASREQVDENVEVLKYSSRQLTKVDSELLFVLDTSRKREVRRTVFFECVDGVLSRHWVEETQST